MNNTKTTALFVVTLIFLLAFLYLLETSNFDLTLQPK